MKKSKIYFLYVLNLFFLMLSFSASFSQTYKNTISGYIVDEETGEPVEYVNVYIAHTTRGASTDRDGYYIIKSIPPGNHQLAVSVVGYRFKSEIVMVEPDSDLKINFRLKPEIYDTETIDVESSVPKEWLNDLANFKRLFLGKSEFARSCIIENQEIIDLKWNPPGYLNAEAKHALIINNQALGYKIHCHLVNFYWDNNNGNWGWSVIPRFTELEPKDEDEKEKWSENRKIAYSGSMYHFLHSLINKQIYEEGYEIYFVRNPGDKIHSSGFSHSFIEYNALLNQGSSPSEFKFHFKYCMNVKSRYYNKQSSWIVIRYPEVTIDEFGYPREINPFKVYGYWAERGLADQVPKYFELE